jgi:hypothetical protein
MANNHNLHYRKENLFHDRLHGPKITDFESAASVFFKQENPEPATCLVLSNKTSDRPNQ